MALAAVLLWTLVVAASLAWNLWQQERGVVEEARNQARAALETQAAIRRFVTHVGGVYVAVDKGVEPSPFLAHLPYRDILDPDGRLLTLVNSSYLIRLIDETTEDPDSVRVRATALRFLSEQNAPDPWERDALRRIHDGAPYWSEVVSENGKRWLRELRPRIASPACLDCHQKQGVNAGEILGGLSVKVSLLPLEAAKVDQIRGIWGGHGLIWCLGLAGILWGHRLAGRWGRQQAEMKRQLAQELRNERTLSDILEISLSDQPFESQLHRILEVTTHSAVADLQTKGAIFLADPENECLQMVAWIGLYPSLLETCLEVPYGRCLCGRVAASREILFASKVDDRHETRYPGMSDHGHYCIPILDGEHLLGVFTLYVAPGHLRDEQEVRFLSAVADIMGTLIKRHFAQQRLKQQAYYDALTGLPNRSLFMDRLHHHLDSEHNRKRSLSAVMFLDLDGFKPINDSMGHEFGDRLLAETARRIAECVRPQDTVARLGGDEFTVLLKDLGHRETAVDVAERIQKALASPFDLDGEVVTISTSIGIAFTDTPNPTTENLLRAADIAMYQAKAKGKGCSVIFDIPIHDTDPGNRTEQ
jgi:diguanylate cyclase (GGDEF)-like protein